MKRWTYILALLTLAVLMLLPLLAACGATPAPAPAPAPSPAPAPTPVPAVQVPITYPGDTDQSIARRAQLIEGAKKEGTLVYWGILPPDQAQVLFDEFLKYYPFLKIDYWRGSGEESGTKIEAEAVTGKFTVDVDLGSIQFDRLPAWRQNGWLEKWTTIIPGWQQMGGMIGPDQDWAFPGQNAIIPQYNTNLVTAAEAPKSWEDLLDPKWKGQIGLPPSTTHWQTLATAEGGWGVEKTLDYLRKLRQQDIVWLEGGFLGGHSLMVAGEVKIMGVSLLPHYINAKKDGAPVEWVRANPATVGGPFYTMTRGGPHPNAAKLWMEWQFSPRGLELYEKVSAKGAVYPGATTVQAKMLNDAGVKVVYTTEASTLKVLELDLVKQIQAALGMP